MKGKRLTRPPTGVVLVMGGINPLGLSKLLLPPQMERGLAMGFVPPTTSYMKKVIVDVAT